MNSKRLQLIKNKLKTLLKDKEILDIILFGSTIRGKVSPKDTDIALITNKKDILRIPNFHTSIISPEEFLTKFPTITTTLLQEGYSLKHNKFLAELFRFKNKTLYTYSLTEKKPSEKVRIVNVLRGKKLEEGIIKERKGHWLANQVFILPIESSHLIDLFFIEHKIKFKKHNILIN